jgi:ketosteroid isomerase-like protein
MSHIPAVQAIYQAFGAGKVPEILDALHENVKWEHDSVDHGIPWLKPGRGKLHAMEFFKTVGREFEMSRFDVKGLFENGPQVIALIDIEAKIRSTGKPIKDVEIHLWTFNDAGKVKYFRHVVDTHQHLLASKR